MNSRRASAILVEEIKQLDPQHPTYHQDIVALIKGSIGDFNSGVEQAARVSSLIDRIRNTTAKYVLETEA